MMMFTGDQLRELGGALPEYSPAVKVLGGKPRLLLTFAASETVEVSHMQGQFFRVETVKLATDGRAERFLLAVVYGIALIPPMVREYVTGMEKMRSSR